MLCRLGASLLVTCAVAGCTMSGDNSGPQLNVSLPVPPTTVTYLDRVQGYADILTARYRFQKITVVAAFGEYAPGEIISGNTGFDRCTIPDGLVGDAGVTWTPGDVSQSTFSLSANLPANIASIIGGSANLNLGSSTELTFDGMTQHMIDVAPFEQVLKSADCAPKIAALQHENPGQNVTVVEGTLTATETYTFNHNPSAGIGINSRFGDFNLSVAPNKQTLSLQEAQPSEHFLVVYQVPPSADATPVVVAAATPTPAPAPPAAAPPVGAAATAPPPPPATAAAPVLKFVPAPAVTAAVNPLVAPPVVPAAATP